MRRFMRDESGLALTEYLTLLALLTSAAVTGVSLYGGALADRLNGWGDFIATALPAPGGIGETVIAAVIAPPAEDPAPVSDPEPAVDSGPAVESTPVSDTTGPVRPEPATPSQPAAPSSEKKNCSSDKGKDKSGGKSAVSC